MKNTDPDAALEALSERVGEAIDAFLADGAPVHMLAASLIARGIVLAKGECGPARVAGQLYLLAMKFGAEAEAERTATRN